MSTGVIIFIVAILVVIMIHEAGHFVVAKIFNFKATKFFVGFGPTVWSFNKGETEYGVKAIPAGGFVKIVGMNPYEEVAAADEPRSYPNKPRWQRALVLLAGSATHFLVAFVLLFTTAMTIGFPTDDVTSEISSLVSRAEDGERTPAAIAGLAPEDRIVGIGGIETTSWTRIRNFIREHPGERVAMTVEKADGATDTVSVRLAQILVNDAGETVDFAPPGEELDARPGHRVIGFLGVQPSRRHETEGVGGAFGRAGSVTWDFTTGSISGVGQVFGMVFDGTLWDAIQAEGDRTAGEGPVGLIGAGRIAGQAFQQGLFFNLVLWIVGFTVFVGIMNLLPLPPLDGGHLAVVAYEAVTGRAVDVRKLIPIAAAVISFFVLLFVAVLYLDLARPIDVPF